MAGDGPWEAGVAGAHIVRIGQPQVVVEAEVSGQVLPLQPDAQVPLAGNQGFIALGKAGGSC